MKNVHLIHIKPNSFESVVNPSQHTQLVVLIIPSVLLGLHALVHRGGVDNLLVAVRHNKQLRSNNKCAYTPIVAKGATSASPENMVAGTTAGITQAVSNRISLVEEMATFNKPTH